MLPLLFAAGALDGTLFATLPVGGGGLVRTLYTLGRFLQAAWRGERLPWVALGVGALPVAGNLAYPAQLVASSTGPDRALPRFILYDSCAALGRAFPVWGGSHSLLEHWFNRLPEALFEFLGRRRNSAGS